MTRTLTALALTLGLTAGPVFAQSVRFPETPQGRLAAGFFAAANEGDENALARFQEDNFTEAALRRRPEEERKANNRQLRQSAGKLTLVEVRSATETRLVVTASGSQAPGFLLTITFSFTPGPSPKIDGIQITST